jgi:hypothetical protein
MREQTGIGFSSNLKSLIFGGRILAIFGAESGKCVELGPPFQSERSLQLFVLTRFLDSEPGSTPDQVRGRLSPQSALEA